MQAFYSTASFSRNSKHWICTELFNAHFYQRGGTESRHISVAHPGALNMAWVSAEDHATDRSALESELKTG